MIWKRIVIVGGMAFAMLIGFMMIIFWACGIAQAKGETALLLYPFLGLLCFIGFLSGWLQPQTDDPWRVVDRTYNVCGDVAFVRIGHGTSEQEA
jgi:hypothetical protein